MNLKYFELQHKQDLLASDTDKIWRLEDIRLSTSGWQKRPTKRTLERWISKIPWLKSSNQVNDQLDESTRAANQLVLDAFVSGARKKPQSCLVFTCTIFLLPMTISLTKNLMFWLRRTAKEPNVGAFWATNRFQYLENFLR